MGLIFTIEKDLGWMSWLDYGMFIQNISLAARGYGLHSCAQAAWGLVYKKANKLLNIKTNFTVFFGNCQTLSKGSECIWTYPNGSEEIRMC